MPCVGALPRTLRALALQFGLCLGVRGEKSARDTSPPDTVFFITAHLHTCIDQLGSSGAKPFISAIHHLVAGRSESRQKPDRVPVEASVETPEEEMRQLRVKKKGDKVIGFMGARHFVASPPESRIGQH
ncbi:hypothetical protein NDU88_007232 [Pleurodeles waltl]|uniref:Uncharacterized protein n=1 Tax=Pleurodeles waltl TaxID=8319 RepID=A0AAV7URB5_PLEWA|nr:hypothetical protein NDU88_007232 [Pleurodeles waltl]